MHPNKPEKVRVVFDCAAEYQGTSLNQQLLQGPDLANPLVGVLIRFREEPIALVADIESMFHQIGVDPKDRDTLRFLWWENGDLREEPREYRMVRHVFGATSSPSIANLCVKKAASASHDDFDAETVRTVERNMYVDDLMKSTSNTELAINLARQLIELMKGSGFRLTKWISNDRKVISEIPESERAQSVVSLEIDDLPTESTLGLAWNIEDDEFVWKARSKILTSVKQKSMTRRAVLSAVCSLFDPLGFVARFVMKGKLLLQELCRQKVEWDEVLGEREKEQWDRWLEDLSRLKEVRIERCFKPKNFGEVKEAQLHLFSDGSRVGYGAVAYLRVVDVNDNIHVTFIIGRARVAPINEISIPCLELTAAVISVKLSKMIQEELDFPVDSVTYWTDSTSVLKCIYNEKKRFHSFESNRLTIIQSGSSPSQWRYVSSENNPADDASKGLKLDVMLKNNRWLSGPEFLSLDEAHWPANIAIPSVTPSDPEVRRENPIYMKTVKECPLDILIKWYSSWWKLKRGVAWLLRFKELLRKRARKGESTSSTNESEMKDLTVSELRKAESVILRHVQQAAFSEVKTILSAERSKPKKTLKGLGHSIYKLNPVLKDGLLVVGGRLTRADIIEDAKHQIILPYKGRVTDLIIEECHSNVGHMGQESVLSTLRERFWVVKGRSAVRRVIKRCLDCQRRKCQPAEQLMSDLPKERITPDKPPFTFVGVDYFRPLEVKQGRSRVKRYGCIFTCLAVRAVHIEVAHSLDMDSMINALRRFISVRGCPEVIRSDRGTNFTSAERELRKAIDQWNQCKVESFCVQQGIQWLFNPPGASHFGGVWERMIRSTRQILQALLKEQVVSDEVLLTVVMEASNILNSRPLTRNSDDAQDEQPLTPNHLLKLRSCQDLPPGIFDESDAYTKRRWRQAQYMINLFWKRWVREYLPTLQQRQKWHAIKSDMKVGDLVLVMDKDYSRGKWPLGRVIQVLPSKDGLVRTADVKTTSTVVTRVK